MLVEGKKLDEVFSEYKKNLSEEDLGPKYELIDDENLDNGTKRLKALRDFMSVQHRVKKGDIGGIVGEGSILSQEGCCWLDYNSSLSSHSSVEGDVFINHATIISSTIYGDGKISDSIIREANIGSREQGLRTRIEIVSSEIIESYIGVRGFEFDKSYFGKVVVNGSNATFSKCAISESVIGTINSLIGLYDVETKGTFIGNDSDVMVFKNWWSSKRYFTWTRYNNLWKVGCFYGTGEDLIKKAYKDSQVSGREYERIVKMVEESRKVYNENINEYKSNEITLESCYGNPTEVCNELCEEVCEDKARCCDEGCDCVGRGHSI